MSNKFELPISLLELKSEYESGFNTVELSKKYGCSDVTIGKLLNSIGCKREYQGRKLILPLSDQEIKSKYLEGLTLDSLADTCGCTRGSIIKRLKKVGCTLRGNVGHTSIDLPIEKLKQDYASGISIIKLVTKYGSSFMTIRRRLIDLGCDMRGTQLESNGRWKGGVSFQPYCQKFNGRFKESIRDKFNRTCFLCGITEKDMQQDQRERGKKRIYKLSVHHVNYNKNCLCDDSICEFVPLCISCHAKTNSDREYWEAQITERIETLK